MAYSSVQENLFPSTDEFKDNARNNVEAAATLGRFCPCLQTLHGGILWFLHGVEAATVRQFCPCLKTFDDRDVWFLRGMKFHHDFIAPKNNKSHFDVQYGLKMLAGLRNLNLRDESGDGEENYKNIEDDEQYQRIKSELEKLMDEGDDP